MAGIPFVYQYDFGYAKAEQITPLIRRVTARNPSGFTFHGTGTYIIGSGTVAVIDPGPMIPEHIEALQAVLEGETVSHILITHTHFDHSRRSPFERGLELPYLRFWPPRSGKNCRGHAHRGGRRHGLCTGC